MECGLAQTKSMKEVEEDFYKNPCVDCEIVAICVIPNRSVTILDSSGAYRGKSVKVARMGNYFVVMEKMGLRK